ncbi:MAG: GDP-mannose 4,6-dehydratase [Candidatus Micrarchaeota archaeon]
MDLLPFDEVFTPHKFDQLKKSGLLIDINNGTQFDSHNKSNSTKPNKEFWNNKRVLITGVAGMVGSTLFDLLHSLGAEVHGTIRQQIDYPNLKNTTNLKLHKIELSNYEEVTTLIKKVEPQVIFHQAADSFVPAGIQKPGSVVENNCVSTVNLLEAVTKNDKNLEAIQLACSSEQYGFVKSLEELPVKETNELRPTSTYAATKIFTENVGKSYFYSYRTPTVITRNFNQEGPRRGSQYFTSRISVQLKDCLDGKTNKLIMGNPNAVRDFNHIYDSTSAQLIAVEKCNRGEAYNICSGKGITTGEYAKLALRISNLEKTEMFIDKKLLRPYERGEAVMDGIIGDNTKFINQTGWHPTKTVVDIIKDSVAFYSDQLNLGGAPHQR